MKIRITKHELRIMVFALIALFIIHYSLFIIPTYAVNIGEQFGFGQFKSLGEATSQLVNPLFSLVTAAVVIYFLWGAFKYLISRGNKEEIAAARAIIIHAIIGFIILMFAFLILQFLLSSLFGISGFLIQA